MKGGTVKWNGIMIRMRKMESKESNVSFENKDGVMDAASV